MTFKQCKAELVEVRQSVSNNVEKEKEEKEKEYPEIQTRIYFRSISERVSMKEKSLEESLEN